MRLLEVIHVILFDLCSGIPSRVHSDIWTTRLKFVDILCVIVLYLRPFEDPVRLA